MEIITYGTILKKRIKEVGYTQVKFAEKTGVPISTLRKYMNGQSIYPIDLLAVFAKTLDCSYDYLMGFSATPRREIQDIKDKTLLTDSAIDSVIKKADLAKTSNEDIKKECATAYLIALNIILESDDLWDMLTYYMFPKYSLGIMADEVNKVFDTEIDANVLEGTLAFAIVNSLAKSKIKFENKELKKED